MHRRLRRGALATVAAGLIASLCVTAAPAQASTAYAPTVTGDSPVGYWRLGETSGTTAADSSGHGNTGSYSSSVLRGAAGAITDDSDAAAGFDGSSGKVAVPDTAALRLNGAFSIELWAKMTTFANSYPGLLVKGSSGTADGYLVWYSSNGTVHFKRNNYDFTTTAGALTSTGFSQLVVTYTGSTASWYVNGALARTATVTFPTNNGTAALWLGMGDQYGAHVLDDVSFYGSALTAAQVQNHYAAATAAGSSPGPSPTPTTTATASPSPTATATVSPTPTTTATATPTASSSPSPTASPTATTPGSAPVVAVAGDIACDPSDANYNNGLGSKSYCHQQATADLIRSGSYSGVFALGDLQYADGTYDKFMTSYDTSWGAFKAKTYPVPGNHEYLDTNAAGYYRYWGAAAGDPSKGYYSFDLGTWHVIVLNGECSYVGGCGSKSPQETWLRNDLGAHKNKCTVAMWHEPRYSSGDGGDNGTGYTTFWKDLYNANADLILAGHIHDYERFAPQNPSGGLDKARGIREFVVGTGGKSLVGFPTALANSEVRNADTYGVLSLTLASGSYSWKFVPEAGKTFTDSGSASCH